MVLKEEQQPIVDTSTPPQKSALDQAIEKMLGGIGKTNTPNPETSSPKPQETEAYPPALKIHQ